MEQKQLKETSVISTPAADSSEDMELSSPQNTSETSKQEKIKKNIENIYELYKKRGPLDLKMPELVENEKDLPPGIIEAINDAEHDPKKRSDTIYVCLAIINSTSVDRIPNALAIYLNTSASRYEDTRGFLEKTKVRKALLFRLEEELEGIMVTKTLDKYLYRIGWLEFDVNGLKGLNDVFGHLTGDELLKMFYHHLQVSPALYQYLKRLNYDAFFAAQGGDEASCLITPAGLEYSGFELNELGPKVVDQLEKEFLSLPASELFEKDRIDPEVEEKFAKAGLKYSEDSKDMFVISASIGMSFLHDAIANLTIRDNDTYEIVVNKIKSLLITYADSRSKTHKDSIKAQILSTTDNPLMKYVFSLRPGAESERRGISQGFLKTIPDLLKGAFTKGIRRLNNIKDKKTS